MVEDGPLNPTDVRLAAMDLLSRREHGSEELTNKLRRRFKRHENALNIIMAEQTLKTARQQDSTSSAQVVRAKRLVDGGRMNKSDLYILEAQKATEQLNINVRKVI